MPKTKFQDFIFSVIMVSCMVYCMTFFNHALNKGLSYGLFLEALQQMWAETLIAFFLQRYVAKPNAARILKKVIGDTHPGPAVYAVANACGNVMVMAPIMTLLVNIMHEGLNANIGIEWASRVVFNLPFALIMQIFYVGPLVRFIYRNIAKCAGWDK